MEMRIPKGPEYYDQVFSESQAYQIHYKHSPYFVLWSQILLWLRQLEAPKILEIGCGTGQLAHYLYDEGFGDYYGFDFSPKAVEIAKQAVDQSFAVGDAFDQAPYEFDYNVAVATEVLEHVADDYAIIKSLRKGTVFIFSLPTYDDPAHIRFFPAGGQVVRRYRGYVQFKAVHLINRWFACLGVIR